MSRLPDQGDVKSAVTNFFDRKQHFDQLSQERAQGSGHASPLNLKRGGHRVMSASHLSQHKPHDWVKNTCTENKASRSQRNLYPPKCLNLEPS